MSSEEEIELMIGKVYEKVDVFDKLLIGVVFQKQSECEVKIFFYQNGIVYDYLQCDDEQNLNDCICLLKNFVDMIQVLLFDGLELYSY